tara:strand:- start:350 stop:634 length:285 start_codon:yes stop_codon:yes gene_type:complete
MSKFNVDQFIIFDEENPEIYALFRKLALKAFAVRSKYSARGILHVMRWESMLHNDHGGTYKVNNTWSPHFAKKFMAELPEYEGFFELRSPKGAI